MAYVFSYSFRTGLRGESLRKSNKYPNLACWFNSISSEHSDALNEMRSAYVGKQGAGNPVTAKPKKHQISKGDVSEKGKSVSRTAEVNLPDGDIGKVCLPFAP
ncbi:Glutamyl/glutaminyl-tRNA synthetase class Ic [Euphorbia peplus]|nr:Glutamyl/glutaminyl-tRNA synthetase class Ic [Euphorbia peplus]